MPEDKDQKPYVAIIKVLSWSMSNILFYHKSSRLPNFLLVYTYNMIFSSNRGCIVIPFYLVQKNGSFYFFLPLLMYKVHLLLGHYTVPKWQYDGDRAVVLSS